MLARSLMNRNGAAFPFPSIAAEMDRLFESLAPASGLAGPRPGAFIFPALNIWEDENAIFVEAELPGVSMNDLDLSATGDELTIRGTRKFEPPEEARSLRRERLAGTFERSFTLPADVDVEKAEATLQNGVLRISLPKAPHLQPRKIDIKTSQK